MRIAIDLSSLLAKPTGVDRYINGLVYSLVKFHPAHEYFLFINGEDRELVESVLESTGNRSRASIHIFPLSRRQRPPRIFLQQVLMPAIVEARKIDVVHSPAFIMPRLRGRAAHVLAIQDMTSFLLPQCHPLTRRGRLYEAAVGGSIRRADLVTVPAKTVRDDVLRLLPDVAPDKVRMIPYGVDDVFSPRTPDEVSSVLKRLGVQWPYVLYIGTLDPRKNLPRLVESFAKLVERGRPEHLVLGGQYGWSVSELLQKLSLPAIHDRVHMLGYVAEADLPALYTGSRLFAYPSLLEGFGFPPLEAMACGVPVVASRSSSLSDNLEGGAVLVAPEDVEAITGAMERLLSDDAWRERHIQVGLERAASFRWEAFASATEACYREIALQTHTAGSAA